MRSMNGLVDCVNGLDGPGLEPFLVILYLLLSFWEKSECLIHLTCLQQHPHSQQLVTIMPCLQAFCYNRQAFFQRLEPAMWLTFLEK